jgi:hypothetical protein
MDYNQLRAFVSGSDIPGDKKSYVLSVIDNHVQAIKFYTDPDKIAARDKALASSVRGAVAAYLDEKEANKLSTILKGTVRLTAEELSKPFAGIWDSLKFLTNPVVLVILVLVIFGAWYYFQVVKK